MTVTLRNLVDEIGTAVTCEIKEGGSWHDVRGTALFRLHSGTGSLDLRIHPMMVFESQERVREAVYDAAGGDGDNAVIRGVVKSFTFS